MPTKLERDGDGLRINLLAEQIFHRFAVDDFCHKHRIFGVQDQVVIPSVIGIQIGVLHQLNPPVTRHIIDYLGDYVLWYIIFGILMKCIQDLPDFHPRSGGVPQRKGCNTVGVDMFGAFFQLCKAGECVSCPLIKWAVNFEEDCPIALDDQWVLWIVRHRSNPCINFWWRCDKFDGFFVIQVGEQGSDIFLEDWVEDIRCNLRKRDKDKAALVHFGVRHD